MQREIPRRASRKWVEVGGTAGPGRGRGPRVGAPRLPQLPFPLAEDAFDVFNITGQWTAHGLACGHHCGRRLYFCPSMFIIGHCFPPPASTTP